MSDLNTPIDQVSAFGTSSDTNLVAADAIVVSGTTSNRTLQITPTGQAGAATITIGTDDGETASSVSFILLINDSAREAPTDLTFAPDPLQVVEHSPSNFVVATLAAVDLTLDDVHTFELIDDADGRFMIVDDELRVRDSERIDFEVETAHSLLIRVTKRPHLR